MDSLDSGQNLGLQHLAVDIVAAFVAHNRVSTEELPGLIRSVFDSLSQQTPGGAGEAREPAVPVRSSVARDHLVCLEDGRRFKSLKRHLRTAHNLSPADYRTRWGLRADYPLVAPAYAAQRSELAKAIGLGQKSEGRGRGKRAAR